MEWFVVLAVVVKSREDGREFPAVGCEGAKLVVEGVGV